MSTPPRLKFPEGLELRPAAPAMPTATLPHPAAAKLGLLLQTSPSAALPPAAAGLSNAKARQPVAVQPAIATARPPTGHPTTIRPAAAQTTSHPAAAQPTSQPAAAQLPTRQAAPVQPTTRQLTAVQSAGQPATVQPTTTPVSHPVTTQVFLSSGRRDNEPVPKKRRLLEATEAADNGHEMTKTGTKQGDAEDILARVCSAVGIDSDLVESVVEDPPNPGHQHSAVVGGGGGGGRGTHTVPGHLQYLRGVRPLHPGIPPAHRLRRPELRFHSSMHPAYRVSPDASYALAEVRHPYPQYHYRPHDPAYVVQNHMAVRPGEQHQYRPFPHYINRYQCVGPVAQPMGRSPALRPGPPMGSSDRCLPVPPQSSPTLPQPGEIRHYPAPGPPPALHHDPRRVPPVVHHIHHKVPGVKHIPPGHSEIPYGVPTSRHDSSSGPSPVPEHPAATAASRPLLASSQRPPRPALQECGDQQKQRGGLREVYLPATSVSAHHPQGSPYPLHPYQGHGQYHHLYPRVSEPYSYGPRAEPARDAVRQDAAASRAPVISLQPPPDKRLQTVSVRSPYIPEQVQGRDQIWGVKRPSDALDRFPEVVQMRRTTMEPPKPCVELIPIGPPRDARERKSVGEESHNAGSVAAPDCRPQGAKTSGSQYTQLLERPCINADPKVLVAAHGHAAQKQTLAAYVAQPASLPDTHRGRSPMTAANPELLHLTKGHPGVFRRPLSSDPSFSRGETSANEAYIAHRYNRCNSDPTNTHSRTFEEKIETSEKRTDSRFSTHNRISNTDDTENPTTSPQARGEERVSQTEPDHIKAKEDRVLMSAGDTTAERVATPKTHCGDLTHAAHQEERGQETHHKADIEKIEKETRSEGPGQVHIVQGYVKHHRPASEPPLGLIPATNEAVSSRKRSASLPSAGQHNPTTMRCRNDLAKPIPQHQENSELGENPGELEKDKVFMERLKLVLNDLLSVPEATKLQQLSCSTEQLLASVVQRGGAIPSKDPSPRKRLREDFKTVVKLCLPTSLLKYWGWDLCSPDQILDQLIKVTQNGDDGVNGSMISTPSSPLTRDDVLEDDVFSPPPCSAPRPFIPTPYTRTTPVPEPPHDLISHAPNTRTAQPCAYTSTTYTKHHHIPVPYVPAASVMPSCSLLSTPACNLSLNSNVITRCPSDSNSDQVYATGAEEHTCSNPGKKTNPPSPHHAQHTAVKWPGSNNNVVGSPVCTPVSAKAPAT